VPNRPRLIPILILGFALVAVSAAPGAFGQSRPTTLCRIIDSLDPLLHCTKQSESPPPSTSSEEASTSSENLSGSTPTSASTASAGVTGSARVASLPVLAPHTVSPAHRFVPNLLMARFKPGLTARRRAQVLAGAGGVVDHQIEQLGVFVLRTPPGRRDQVLARLSASSSVAGVEKDAIIEKLDTSPNDTSWADQWGLQRIGLPSVWDQTRGSPIVVAVLDTGVDAVHPDLRGAVLPGVDLTASSVGANDLEGHGTAVAGIIAARANNHQGIAGICWSCSILPVKVLNDEAQGSMDELAEGIVKAADAGARVVSMSLGGPEGSGTLDQAISYAVAKDVILVAAAGNNSSSTPFYPAANPSVLSVAGTNEADSLYPWSDFGTWVRLAAPGCNPAPVVGGGYATFCGTSSATPVVSGLIALALSIRPNLSRDEIARALSAASESVATVPQGRIDAPATLDAVAPGKKLAPTGPRIATATFHGSLTPTRLWRVHQRVVRVGNAAGTLTFPKDAWLTLSLISSGNKVLTSVSGHTPLRLNRQLEAGLYWFGVASAKPIRASYTLTVSARP
jgi:subtilisin family serine protease